MSADYMTRVVDVLTKTGGRVPGKSGHTLAKHYLVRELLQLGIIPGNNGLWLQPISDFAGYKVGDNVVGILPGKGSKYICLVAHYDTVIGTPGADDNAAAIAIILETIMKLRTWQGEASILVLFPDTEEPPYFHTDLMGSVYFYNHCPVPVEKIALAGILDLVGHDVPILGVENALFVTGAETCYTLKESVEKAEKDTPELGIFPVRNIIVGNLSDHHVFQRNHCPFLFLSCGQNQHYHGSSDTIDKLNMRKMGHISKFLRLLLININERLEAIPEVLDITYLDEG